MLCFVFLNDYFGSQGVSLQETEEEDAALMIFLFKFPSALQSGAILLIWL